MLFHIYGYSHDEADVPTRSVFQKSCRRNPAAVRGLAATAGRVMRLRVDPSLAVVPAENLPSSGLAAFQWPARGPAARTLDLLPDQSEIASLGAFRHRLFY